MIDVDVDGDRAKFTKVTYHKARKPHRCQECGKEIGPGMEYEKLTWCDSDGFETSCTCSTCREIRDCFLCSYYYGGLWDELCEFFRWNPDELCIGTLDKLSIPARDVMIPWVDELLESVENCRNW
jgi:hypothetical protein